MAGNQPLELNRAVPGGRVEMFAVDDDDYPGGWFYRFQYYHPEAGEILRYDNAHDDETLGWHHRHVRFGEDTEIEFENITSHVARFLQDVAHIIDTEAPTMTEPTDDGWPDEYRDPRDRPHPSVLRVTVESFEEMQEETIDSAESADSEEGRPAVVSFRTVSELRKILTDRRIELLRALVAREEAAESISTLADDLERDYGTVHGDVSLLADYGLLFIVEDGRAKRPYLPYDRIHLDVELVGGQPGEEPTPA